MNFDKFAISKEGLYQNLVIFCDKCSLIFFVYTITRIRIMIKYYLQILDQVFLKQTN